jgi:hypothetical protein
MMHSFWENIHSKLILLITEARASTPESAGHEPVIGHE